MKLNNWRKYTKAKEMFEELGYKLHETNHFVGDVVYEIEESMNGMHLTTIISFDSNNKEVCKYLRISQVNFQTDCDRYFKAESRLVPQRINIEELQAINKQIEELEWNNESSPAEKE